MPIPEFEKATGYLPAGTHKASMEEVQARFARGPKRKAIFRGLEMVVARLWACGVTGLWLDGSFVTVKSRPSDADLVYEIRDPGVNIAQLDAYRLRDHAHIKRSRMVDLWPMPSPQPKAGKLISIKGFFESDAADNPKGIIEIQPPPVGPHAEEGVEADAEE